LRKKTRHFDKKLRACRRVAIAGSAWCFSFYGAMRFWEAAEFCKFASGRFDNGKKFRFKSSESSSAGEMAQDGAAFASTSPGPATGSGRAERSQMPC
jgi:hypothetical protein